MKVAWTALAIALICLTATVRSEDAKKTNTTAKPVTWKDDWAWRDGWAGDWPKQVVVPQAPVVVQAPVVEAPIVGWRDDWHVRPGWRGAYDWNRDGVIDWRDDLAWGGYKGWQGDWVRADWNRDGKLDAKDGWRRLSGEWTVGTWDPTWRGDGWRPETVSVREVPATTKWTDSDWHTVEDWALPAWGWEQPAWGWEQPAWGWEQPTWGLRAPVAATAKPVTTTKPVSTTKPAVTATKLADKTTTKK